jgi:hypothetical protein
VVTAAKDEYFRDVPRTRSIGCGALLGLVGLVSGPGVARAAIRFPSGELSYSAPSTCPSERSLADLIEEFLGQSLEAPRAQAINVEVRVERSDAGKYVADIEVDAEGGRSERRLEHEDCEKLAEASALVIALAIDPEATRNHQGPADGPSSEPDPSSRSALSPAEDESPSRESPVDDGNSERWSIVVGGEGLAGEGVLPGLGAGVGLTAGVWHHEQVGIVASGRFWGRRREGVPGAPGAEARLQLVSLVAGVCAMPWSRRIGLETCVMGTVGDLAGEGVGLDNPAAGHGRWSAVLGRLGISANSGPWRLTIGLEAGPALERPRFVVSSGDSEVVVHEAGSVASRAYVGIRWHGAGREEQ